jgi:hypothetical protein
MIFNLLMIYSFTLSSVCIFLGVAYLLTHGFALLQPTLCQNILKKAPRHEVLGISLMALATGWFCWVLLNVDLMEYTPYRRLFVFGVLIGGGLVIFYVRPLLTARALGALLLLLAYVLLDACFMRNEPLKLIIVATAYLYIIAGMILVASPYYLRDALDWIYQTPQRAQVAAVAGCLYGVILLVLGLVVF